MGLGVYFQPLHDACKKRGKSGQARSRRSGAVLCGGRVDEKGYFESSFGKYKNKQWESNPRAEYDKTNHIFKVYHSIGHQNYTPIVTSAAGAWGDVPQVVGVWSYSFDIKFISSKKQAFS